MIPNYVAQDNDVGSYMTRTRLLLNYYSRTMFELAGVILQDL